MTKESRIAIIAAVCVALHLVLRYVFSVAPAMYQAPLLLALVAGGIPLAWELIQKLWKREFGSDQLAGISIVASILLGQYLVGAIVILMLSGGAALEAFASRRASSTLSALAKRSPQIAHRRLSGTLLDIALADIRVGDKLIVLPHEICPVDGVVSEGHGRMDESYLTGEPFEVSKAPGATVLSGAINGEEAIEIQAARLPEDSRYARIMRVMEESERRRPRLRRIADRLGAWYTPAAVAIAAVGWAVSGDPKRFLSVVVIATPCPLLIAIPVAIVGAISLAAQRGIVIRDAGVLERVSTCRTLIFDKTGTLTYGTPVLAEIFCAPGRGENDVLRAAASLEQYSKHPLAYGVLQAAKKRGLILDSAEHVREIPGQGLSGLVGGHTLAISGRDSGGKSAALPPPEGLECVLSEDGQFAALLRFRDEPRQDSRGFISHLGPRHKVRKVMLLSGDREEACRYLARATGITDVSFGKSPEEKLAIVEAETRLDRTLFVGDGLNDAPAMLAATVGVAFGRASDVASEAGGAVILETSLEKVDELIHIGRRMRRIALQSAVAGMALSVLGMVAAVLGYLPPVAGAIAQEVIDLVVVLNAVRVALPPGRLSDFETAVPVENRVV